jgi:hypothetical protein
MPGAGAQLTRRGEGACIEKRGVGKRHRRGVDRGYATPGMPRMIEMSARPIEAGEMEAGR